MTLAASTLVERLSPVERAILDISQWASRPYVPRARRRIAAARRGGGEVDPASARTVLEEFLAAASSGRTEPLVALLTDDGTAVFDGAGLSRTLWRYESSERAATMMRSAFRPTPAKRRLAGGSPAIRLGQVNGRPAVLVVPGGRIVGATAFEISDGKGGGAARLRRRAAACPPHRDVAAARDRRAGHRPVVSGFLPRHARSLRMRRPICTQPFLPSQAARRLSPAPTRSGHAALTGPLRMRTNKPSAA
ncbi:hypothetical protein [Streptomyces sp. NBC_00457]|uniref:hypothetical protein n=1 Tax=Streptomyces sp. NBC_00457 TaxID=2975748 RepID=UPI003FCC9C7B